MERDSRSKSIIIVEELSTPAEILEAYVTLISEKTELMDTGWSTRIVKYN